MTARRAKENLQDAPVSVAAFTAEWPASPGVSYQFNLTNGIRHQSQTATRCCSHYEASAGSRLRTRCSVTVSDRLPPRAHTFQRAADGIVADSPTDRNLRMAALDAIEIETGPNPAGSVIWLHGLGADGHDFEPIVPELVRPGERALRFVFPHAPVRPVTLNGGMAMRAWYDILGFDRHVAQDERGIRATDALVHQFIRRENERGIASSRIVLAGFSQGGAVTLFSGPRYPEKLAGLMSLSCYMLLADRLQAERTPENAATPIFMGHGSYDPIVELRLGEETRRLLESSGYAVEWHTYPMPHSVCAEEVAHIAAWLRRVL